MAKYFELLVYFVTEVVTRILAKLAEIKDQLGDMFGDVSLPDFNK